MLVNGWTFKGACCSSYGYTMSFRASTQQDCEKLSTRDKQSCDKQSSDKLSSLLSSNKFSLSARRSLALYDFYRRFTTSQKSDKATRIAVKSTGAAVDFILYPPPESAVKSNSYPNISNLQFNNSKMSPLKPHQRLNKGSSNFLKYRRCLTSFVALTTGMTFGEFLKGGCYE